MLLLIDKPKGITSHDVVGRVRRIFNERRVGHAGTLDPNATGLLIVAVGRETTKTLGLITTNTTKTYIGEIKLGTKTDTDDSEGKVIEEKDVRSMSEKEVLTILDTFLGKQSQIPPIYSAIKKNGKKAYEQARRGIQIEMEPRDITVYSLKLLSFDSPILTVECEVSAGTYIRALARDIGEKLGTGAHLSNLRRTKIGDYSIENAVKLEELRKEE